MRPPVAAVPGSEWDSPNLEHVGEERDDILQMATNKVEALQRTDLFKELDPNSLSALAELAVEKRLRKDEMLFVSGEPARGMYVIVRGSVRAFRESPDGREQVIHIEREGASIAEVPVFDGGAYPSSVAAEEETTVLFIDSRDVRSICLAHPEIAFAALKVMAGRLRRCAELVEALSLKEVVHRLARFLLAEARSNGTRTAKGFRLNLTHTNQQIAARIGTVREVVSRAMTRLQHDGLIKSEGRQLTIPDEEALESFASQF